MRTAALSRFFLVIAIVVLCSAVDVPSVWADPVTITSGLLQIGRAGPRGGFNVSGDDGFVLNAIILGRFVTTACSPQGCRPGTIFNMSILAGEGSGQTVGEIPPAFTLGTSSGAIVNGTQFGRPTERPPVFPPPLGLTGSLRFTVPPIVLPSSATGSNAFGAPFVMNGHVTGFAISDVNARSPLFDVSLVGHGTAFADFELSGGSDRFEADSFSFSFDGAPAATPEPATLGLFGTGLVNLIARARRNRRRP
jgi:hypothetical protein